MKWINEYGAHYLEGDRWLVQLIEEWSQVWQDCNWYTFHPVKIEIENDAALGGFEITIILMGFGLRWRWNYTETEKMAEIKHAIEDIKYGKVRLDDLPPLDDACPPRNHRA